MYSIRGWTWKWDSFFLLAWWCVRLSFFGSCSHLLQGAASSCTIFMLGLGLALQNTLLILQPVAPTCGRVANRWCTGAQDLQLCKPASMQQLYRSVWTNKAMKPLRFASMSCQVLGGFVTLYINCTMPYRKSAWIQWAGRLLHVFCHNLYRNVLAQLNNIRPCVQMSPMHQSRR